MNLITRELKADGPYRYNVTIQHDDQPWTGDEPLSDEHACFVVSVEIACVTSQNWTMPTVIGRAYCGGVALLASDPGADPYAETLANELVIEAEDDLRLLRETMLGPALNALRGCRDMLRESAKSHRVQGYPDGAAKLCDLHADEATTALAAINAEADYAKAGVR